MIMTAGQLLKTKGLTAYRIHVMTKDICTKATIYGIMKDQISPNLCLMFKICKVLGFTGEEIANFYKQYKHDAKAY